MSFNVPTRGFRGIPQSSPGRLRMAPLRDRDSLELDDQIEPIPYESWHRFYPTFRDSFGLGDHILLLGRTGFGKTYFLVNVIVPLRRYVVVLGTKPRDSSLYTPLTRQGFVFRSNWDEIDLLETPKVIFRPPLSAPTVKEVKAIQREAFNEALLDMFEMGNICVACDEIRYLTDFLGLRDVIELMYLQGRSNGITMVAGTQRPVSIPLVAFEMATHQFVWRLTGLEDAKRASEYLGRNARRARTLIPRLPKFEFLYNNAATDYTVRSKAPNRR